MSTQNAGILGLGMYLPEIIRKNDWWPEDVVAKWKANADNSFFRFANVAQGDMSEGAQLTLKALQECADDPFQGCVERRVMPEDMTSFDMQTEAAKAALKDANVSASDVDFILTYTMVPDYLHVPASCVVGKNIGVREKCFALETDAVCNSFQMQLTLAQQFIRSGMGKVGLLVQSSALSRLAPPTARYSALWGDGATAVVVGAVPEDKGVLGYSHHTSGDLWDALVVGVPNKRWYDEGRVVGYPLNSDHARKMLLVLADSGKQAVDGALKQANLTAKDVTFYASHQATGWFRPVTQQVFGLGHARTADTFRFLATITGANVPAVLFTGRNERQLRRGDVVAMFSGGTGMTWSSTILRWDKD